MLYSIKVSFDSIENIIESDSKTEAGQAVLELLLNNFDLNSIISNIDIEKIDPHEMYEDI